MLFTPYQLPPIFYLWYSYTQLIFRLKIAKKMENNDKIWEKTLGELELLISKANFTTWFKNTSIVSKDGDAIVVSVPNGFIKEWLENKFNKKI